MAGDQDVKPKWGWTKILLIISLALNLAVAGIVIGASFGHKHAGDRSERFFGVGMRPYVASLPESQRQNVRKRLIQGRETARAVRRDLHQSARNVQDALSGDPFDPAALRGAFAEQRTIYGALAANGHEALVDILANMSDRDRAQFVENLKSYKRTPGGDAVRR